MKNLDKSRGRTYGNYILAKCGKRHLYALKREGIDLSDYTKNEAKIKGGSIYFGKNSGPRFVEVEFPI